VRIADLSVLDQLTGDVARDAARYCESDSRRGATDFGIAGGEGGEPDDLSVKIETAHRHCCRD
jgi:hypothetical protein